MANLFNNIAELKEDAPSVDLNTNTANIFPYVDDAAEAYVIPFISRAYYDELIAEAGSLPVITGNNVKTFYLIRKALANFGLYDAFPFMSLKVGNAGASEQSNEETNPTRQWVYRDARRAYMQKADIALDAALKIMETTPANFATWTGSDEYADWSAYFFTSTSQFNKILSINNSRRTFQKLVPSIAMAEDRQIKPAIGITLMAELKANGGADAFKTETLRLLRRALAYYAMYYGSDDLILNIENDGITLVSHSDGIQSKTSADPNRLANWRLKIKGLADGYLAELKKYLDDNIENISEYKSDDASENLTPGYDIPDNTGSTASVML
jgi:hypothetical protein